MDNKYIINTNDMSDLPAENRIGEYSISYDFSDSGAEKKTRPDGYRTIKKLQISPLAIGIGLAAIESECLYNHMGCICMSQYIHKLCEDGKMDLYSLHYWLYIGEIYINHQKELAKIDFTEDDGSEKLLYLDEALKFNDRDEVFSKLKNLSPADFIYYVESTSENTTSGTSGKSFRGTRSAIGSNRKQKPEIREAG